MTSHAELTDAQLLARCRARTPVKVWAFRFALALGVALLAYLLISQFLATQSAGVRVIAGIVLALGAVLFVVVQDAVDSDRRRSADELWRRHGQAGLQADTKRALTEAKSPNAPAWVVLFTATTRPAGDCAWARFEVSQKKKGYRGKATVKTGPRIDPYREPSRVDEVKTRSWTLSESRCSAVVSAAKGEVRNLSQAGFDGVFVEVAVVERGTAEAKTAAGNIRADQAGDGWGDILWRIVKEA